MYRQFFAYELSTLSRINQTSEVAFFFQKNLPEVLHCRFWRLCTVCCMHVLIFFYIQILCNDNFITIVNKDKWQVKKHLHSMGRDNNMLDLYSLLCENKHRKYLKLFWKNHYPARFLWACNFATSFHIFPHIPFSDPSCTWRFQTCAKFVTDGCRSLRGSNPRDRSWPFV